MKAKAIIFLNGSYPSNHRQFYIDEYHNCKDDSVVIAADGGLRFFIDNNIKPDVIVGDMDSIDSDNIVRFPKAVIAEVSTEGKSLTDGELALGWCVGNNITDVAIYGGIDTLYETDHLLGNIFMMFDYKDKFSSIKMRDYCQEIIPLEDDEYTGEGKPDDMLSVIPLSDEIVYEADGLKYDPGGRVYKFGQTTPLRNELADSRFRIIVKGRAVIVSHYKGG